MVSVDQEVGHDEIVFVAFDPSVDTIKFSIISHPLNLAISQLLAVKADNLCFTTLNLLENTTNGKQTGISFENTASSSITLTNKAT